MSQMHGLSYEAQLKWLEQQTTRARVEGNVFDVHAILSISQSVKDARDHNVNCRRVVA